MPRYVQLGEIPRKRLTQFRKPDGSLYAEQVFGTKGFSGIASILYHHHPPVRVVDIKPCEAAPLEDWKLPVQRHVHTRTLKAEPLGDPISGRRVLMYNNDCRLGIVLPHQPDPRAAQDERQEAFGPIPVAGPDVVDEAHRAGSGAAEATACAR